MVSFITNFEWLHGLSHPGMRERFLEAFDIIRIDNLNGDSRETGKQTPDGLPDPSVFSTEHNRAGITKGTAISTMIRKEDHQPTSTVELRQLWGVGKRQQLLDSAESDPAALYAHVKPSLAQGLAFVTGTVRPEYLTWPKLTELLPVSFPGVKTSRDAFLVAIDKEKLEERLDAYFNPAISHEQIRARFPTVMNISTNYHGVAVREALIKRGRRVDQPVRYAYRPFDVRWLYWDSAENLVDREREEYFPIVKPGNLFLSAGARNRQGGFYQPQIVAELADHHLVESNVGMFPLSLDHGDKVDRPNSPPSVQTFTSSAEAPPEAMFWHIVAMLHAPSYPAENAAALRSDWPRVPVPAVATVFRDSAALGRMAGSILNSAMPVPGVSIGAIRSDLRPMGTPVKRGGKELKDSDLALTAGWGYAQIKKKTGAQLVMPGSGLTRIRDYTEQERNALKAGGEAIGLPLDSMLALLGTQTLDIHLNADAWWANVPLNVWDYKLGGYAVVKKWLSYREQALLNRALKPDEVAYFSEMVRRIAAILLMGPALDENYAIVKANPVAWTEGKLISASQPG